MDRRCKPGFWSRVLACQKVWYDRCSHGKQWCTMAIAWRAVSLPAAWKCPPTPMWITQQLLLVLLFPPNASTWRLQTFSMFAVCFLVSFPFQPSTPRSVSFYVSFIPFQPICVCVTVPQVHIALSLCDFWKVAFPFHCAACYVSSNLTFGGINVMTYISYIHQKIVLTTCT